MTCMVDDGTRCGERRTVQIGEEEPGELYERVLHAFKVWQQLPRQS